jgi:hypothetical protein
MTLSEQLSKLATRAKQAETRAAEAEHKAASDLKGDVAAARATARAEAVKLRENAEARRGEISDWWFGVQKTWNEYVDAVHQTIEEADAEIDLAHAEHAADTAESDASYAIDYAYAAIEQAEYAVLHAEFARIKANDLKAGAHATA